MNTNPSPQTIVLDLNGLLQRLQALEDQVADQESRLDALDDELFAGEGELEVDTVRCRHVAVGDGSCSTPISLWQRGGDSYLGIPGGTGGAMIVLGAYGAGSSMLAGTDPGGHVRWAMGFDVDRGCHFPVADVRRQGDEHPEREAFNQITDSLQSVLGLGGYTGMAGITG